jgi:hypothetical protein
MGRWVKNEKTDDRGQKAKNEKKYDRTTNERREMAL